MNDDFSFYVWGHLYSFLKNSRNKILASQCSLTIGNHLSGFLCYIVEKLPIKPNAKHTFLQAISPLFLCNLNCTLGHQWSKFLIRGVEFFLFHLICNWTEVVKSRVKYFYHFFWENSSYFFLYYTSFHSFRISLMEGCHVLLQFWVNVLCYILMYYLFQVSCCSLFLHLVFYCF